MPTNLPPDYYDIEAQFRAAQSNEEKIALLEMETWWNCEPDSRGWRQAVGSLA